MRRVFIQSLLLFACAVFSAGTVSAASNNARIPSWKQSPLEEGDPAIRSLYILAVCVRNHHRDQVEALLRTVPGTSDERVLLPAILTPGECPMRAATLTIRNADLLRGALAEAIYNGSKARPRSAQPLPADFIAKIPGHQPADPKSVGGLVAACAVQRAPMRAHQVVQYNPGARGEYRALTHLNATFLECLPSGISLQISRVGVRARLAEALYHALRAHPELFDTRAL